MPIIRTSTDQNSNRKPNRMYRWSMVRPSGAVWVLRPNPFRALTEPSGLNDAFDTLDAGLAKCGSTHPAPKDRIKDIEKNLPRVLPLYARKS
jgi:hypothetical protein